MQKTNKSLLINVILVCIIIQSSAQNLLWNMINRGRTMFTDERYPQPPSSGNVPDSGTHHQDDGSYEKPTHRETESSERFSPNSYDRKPKQQQHEYSPYPQPPPSSPSDMQMQPYKAKEGYYGKYLYAQERQPNILNFYSFLGGLSFASLLATTFIVLSRRNGSLFRTFEDDDLYRRSYKKKYFEWDDVMQLPTTFFKLMDKADALWMDKEKQTTKKSTF